MFGYIRFLLLKLNSLIMNTLFLRHKTGIFSLEKNADHLLLQRSEMI